MERPLDVLLGSRLRTTLPRTKAVKIALVVKNLPPKLEGLDSVVTALGSAMDRVETLHLHGKAISAYDVSLRDCPLPALRSVFIENGTPNMPARAGDTFILFDAKTPRLLSSLSIRDYSRAPDGDFPYESLHRLELVVASIIPGELQRIEHHVRLATKLKYLSITGRQHVSWKRVKLFSGSVESLRLVTGGQVMNGAPIGSFGQLRHLEVIGGAVNVSARWLKGGATVWELMPRVTSLFLYGGDNETIPLAMATSIIRASPNVEEVRVSAMMGPVIFASLVTKTAVGSMLKLASLARVKMYSAVPPEEWAKLAKDIPGVFEAHPELCIEWHGVRDAADTEARFQQVAPTGVDVIVHDCAASELGRVALADERGGWD